MPGPAEIAAQLDETLAAAARCVGEETSQNYDALAQDLNDLGELAYLTCEMHVDHAGLVRKLRAGETLSADEMATARLLMVGDADYYLKYDEEYQRCKAEIEKIVGEIQRLKSDGLAVDGLMHLNVLCREAGSLLALMQHYLEARDRVRRFEASTMGVLDSATARALAGLIEGMFAHTA